jgi:hypothetical protein
MLPRRQQEIEELRGMVSALAKGERSPRLPKRSGAASWNLEPPGSDSLVDTLSGTPLNRAAWLQVLSRTNAGTTRKAWKKLLVRTIPTSFHSNHSDNYDINAGWTK